MARRAGLPHDEIARLYASGMAMRDLASRYGCSKRAIGHIAKKYKLAGRKGLSPPIAGPFETVHPVLRDLFAHAAAQRTSFRALSRTSGVGHKSLLRWARHKWAPDFLSLIAAGEALGLELTWRRKSS